MENPLNYKLKADLFPKQQDFMAAVASREYDFILYGGAIRGGKTIAMLVLFLMLCKKYPNSKYLICRSSLQRIKDTVLPTFYTVRPELQTAQDPSQSNSWEWKHKNGSTIKFYAENIEKDPDLKRFRGLEYDSICFEEMDITIEAFYVGFERCGTWLMKDRQSAKQKGEQIPPQMVIGTSNPQQGWVKELIYDKHSKGKLRSNWLYIESKVYDNPYVPQDWIDRQKENLTPVRFDMMIDGDWEVNTNTKPFFHYFDKQVHVYDNIDLDYSQTVYVSFDFNNVECSCVVGQILYGEAVYITHCFQEDNGLKGLLPKLEWLRQDYLDNKIDLVVTGDVNGDHRNTVCLTSDQLLEDFFNVRVRRMSKSNGSHKHSRRICNTALWKLAGHYFIDGVKAKHLVREMILARPTNSGGLEKTKHMMNAVDAYRYLNNYFFADVKSIIRFYESTQ